MSIGYYKLLLQAKLLTSYTTNYIRQDPDPPSGTDFMGNLIQSFTREDGTHLGPTCGLSWVEVGKSYFHFYPWISLT